MSRCLVACLLLLACGDNLPGRPPRCGDGVIDPGEQCDDANDVDGDGCNGCKLPSCGNGIVDPGEQCDDGVPGLSGDGCSSRCLLEHDVWTDLTPSAMPARFGHAMAPDWATERILMFGGSTTSPSADTWAWDGFHWSLLSPVHAPSPRTGASMVLDIAHRRVLLFGGVVDGNPTNETWVWNGSDWTRLAPAHSPPPRAAQALAYDPVRHVAILIGAGDTWEWNGTDWTEIVSSGAPYELTGTNFGFTYAGSLGAVFVGQSTGFDQWRWNGTTWTRVPAAVAVQPPIEGLVYESAFDRLILLTQGGLASGTWVFDWIYGGWSREVAYGGPSARSATAAVYDPNRYTTVLFGGLDAFQNQPLSDTWTWDFYGPWSRGYEQAPTAREDFEPLPFDTNAGRIILFGGTGEDLDAIDGTWQSDGATWTQLSYVGNGPPPPSWGHAIAFDETYGVDVMFGGCLYEFDADEHRQPDGCRNSTFLWNGRYWDVVYAQHSPGLLPTALDAMTYDRARHRILLFHGGETWEWDGNDWQQIFTAHSPGPTGYAPRLAYDLHRGTAVLFQGDTWEFDGTDWELRSNDRSLAPEPAMNIAYDPIRRRTVMVQPDAIYEWDGAHWNARGTTDRPPSHPTAQLYDPMNSRIFSFGSDPAVPEHRTSHNWVDRLEDGMPLELCDGTDADGDGLVGCADPDCWARCTPLCPPGLSCDPAAPHCGDGTCSQLEDHALCPADCP